MYRLGVLTQLFQMVWHHRSWLLIPPLIALVIALVLVVVVEVTPLGPLIYPLF